MCGVWAETAKDEEIICKEKDVILSSITFIIISLFCLYIVILLPEIPQSCNANFFCCLIFKMLVWYLNYRAWFMKKDHLNRKR